MCKIEESIERVRGKRYLYLFLPIFIMNFLVYCGSMLFFLFLDFFHVKSQSPLHLVAFLFFLYVSLQCFTSIPNTKLSLLFCILSTINLTWFGCLPLKNAAFLIEKVGISVIDGVISALNDTGYNKKSALEITIQSSDSSVLVKMRQQTKYNLMYKIDESIRDAAASSIVDIKKFADSVAVDKESIYPDTSFFIINGTNLINSLHNAGLQVFVYVLRNEFVSQAWDFFSDPYVQINSYVEGASVDGIISDFPASARAYKRNSCRNLGEKMPNYMLPVQVGLLRQLISPAAQPPLLSPLPVLEDSDVAEPPLPSVSPINPSIPTPTPPNQGNASASPTQTSISTILSPASSIIISVLAIVGSVIID